MPDLTIPATLPFLGWGWDDLLFLLLAIGLIGSALVVVLNRDIIRCGLAMIFGFMMLAGLYVQVGAPLVAGAEVLVYIGAISVLILMAIMLTQSKVAPVRLVFHHQAWAGALAAIGLAVVLIVVDGATAWPLAGPNHNGAGATDIASWLFSDYVLPFEIVSVLLLAAVIGGIFLAKRDRPPTDSDI